ncbi:potassium-transporting ATPase subunit C, partial [Microtetraspora sp. AC03309]|nr:potassium-transporting ATPase subunit C [Microtetraspora sp. AC03309]
MMERLPGWIRQHLAAVRALLVLTVVLGAAYPLAVTGVAQAVLNGKANGSLVQKGGADVGSALVGQSFTDKDGAPIRTYFQSRPSAAGDGYDMLASSASNLGPEDVIDVLPDPNGADDAAKEGKQRLLTKVCARSAAVGALEGVSGARPYCTGDGVGAVLK